MPRTRRTDVERALLLSLFWGMPSPASDIARRYNVSRQLTSRYLRQLAEEQIIKSEGKGRWTRYTLRTTSAFESDYVTTSGIREDVAWAQAQPALRDLANEEQDICHYGVTEMFNNALDHSASTKIRLSVSRTAISVRLQVRDGGVGIFQKIAGALGLADPRLALLELSKGRFTTDPTRHTGEGIFFASRMFDRYLLRSADLLFFHRLEDDDWLVEDRDNALKGTRVTMDLLLPSRRVMADVYGRYSSGPDDYRFAKTHVPIRLAKFGDEALISRSAARRVLARIEKFDEVMLDFDGVRTVGQAFADEIFRVFAAEHPRVRLIGINMSAQVTMMVNRASGRRTDNQPQLF